MKYTVHFEVKYSFEGYCGSRIGHELLKSLYLTVIRA